MQKGDNKTVYYKDFFNDVYKGEKFLNGTELLIPIKGIETTFVLLNDTQKNPAKRTTIDLMSKHPIIRRIRWNPNSTELYDLKENNKFLIYTDSNIIGELQTLINLLPEDLQQIIKVKHVETIESVDVRSGRVVYNPVSIGKIWIPSDMEIYGRRYMSDTSPNENQFDFFKKEENRIIKYNTQPTEYWTRTVLPFHNAVISVKKNGFVEQTCCAFIRDTVMCFQCEL